MFQFLYTTNIKGEFYGSISDGSSNNIHRDCIGHFVSGLGGLRPNLYFI
jgi:hypothetical protein